VDTIPRQALGLFWLKRSEMKERKRAKQVSRVGMELFQRGFLQPGHLARHRRIINFKVSTSNKNSMVFGDIHSRIMNYLEIAAINKPQNLPALFIDRALNKQTKLFLHLQRSSI
jgi:hypothetical protein